MKIEDTQLMTVFLFNVYGMKCNKIRQNPILQCFFLTRQIKVPILSPLPSSKCQRWISPCLGSCRVFLYFQIWEGGVRTKVDELLKIKPSPMEFKDILASNQVPWDPIYSINPTKSKLAENTNFLNSWSFSGTFVILENSFRHYSGHSGNRLHPQCQHKFTASLSMNLLLQIQM